MTPALVFLGTLALMLGIAKLTAFAIECLDVEAWLE